ncbi:ABC transporter substrate-binding protein [Wenxinia marina]|uniref:ABC-type dipeptide transport system, periplasmic component n=1 Tax=Wenxinia marina DSM 24838 TaxID=1123501 RepID=A0A0D0NIN0_9RHOB|nr:ABC transporter substrate-binding protein [Wenxinia marina]KIQ68170.1 ABC-type dipeptide transport system, periplasmic component [Wenxinia marina DSM 24838]GGL76464.1 peptide ABC transporter substrate-binding protein [Wenxinia marina]
MKQFTALPLLAAAGLAASAAQAQVTNPDTLVFLWTDDVQSFDPAYISNTPSSYGTLNVYSRLLAYDGEQISEFVPALSTEVPSLENGLIVEGEDGSVSYSFPIRPDTYAHKVGLMGEDGTVTWEYYDDLSEEERANIEPGYGVITAEDVKYSLLRAMLMDESWMSKAVTEMMTSGEYTDVAAIAEDLTGAEVPDLDEAQLQQVYDELDQLISVEGDTVTLHLAQSFPATLGIMALPFGTSIIDKEWTVDMGGWDGEPTTWGDYFRPEASETPLFADENGTGPFMLEEWDRSERRIVLRRFENYMHGPASLERVVLRTVPEWTTQRLQLLSGDADVVSAPVEFLDELAATEGVKVVDGLQRVFGRALFYAWPLQAQDNPAIGSGQLDGQGIPPDFFADLDVRMGFNYAQDYDLLLEQVNLGKTVQSRGPTVRGIMGYREDSPIYTYDPEKAEEHFRAAYDGQLWENGFTMTAYMQEGNTLANAALSVLQQNLARINPKFRLELQALPAASIMDKVFADEPTSPLTYMGWGPDYSDPGGPLGAATYYLSPTGLVAGFSGEGYQELMREHFQPLLDEAWALNDPAEREPIYARLQEMSHEYATSMFLWEDYTYIVTRDWVDGYVNNMILYGAWDFYPITKSASE